MFSTSLGHGHSKRTLSLPELNRIPSVDRELRTRRNKGIGPDHRSEPATSASAGGGEPVTIGPVGTYELACPESAASEAINLLIEECFSKERKEDKGVKKQNEQY